MFNLFEFPLILKDRLLAFYKAALLFFTYSVISALERFSYFFWIEIIGLGKKLNRISWCLFKNKDLNFSISFNLLIIMKISKSFLIYSVAFSNNNTSSVLKNLPQVNLYKKNLNVIFMLESLLRRNSNSLFKNWSFDWNPSP